MEIIYKDILTVDYGIIVHQVNCMGKFGAGLAKSIANKYLMVKFMYLEKFNKYEWKLGDVQFVKINPNFYIANAAGQYHYGRNKNIRYTDYQALQECFEKINNFSISKQLPIILPYGIGCGLANGDWNVVFKMINFTIPDAIICKKG